MGQVLLDDRGQRYQVIRTWNGDSIWAAVGPSRQRLRLSHDVDGGVVKLPERVPVAIAES
jgi:hypothetical protein